MPLTGESGRIPTLDGWRGIAILAVLTSHAATYSRFSQTFWAQQGWTGVDVFFVISGYIITARLIEEGERPDLLGFYQRRAVRILTPVVIYLSLIAILASIRLVHSVTWSELLGALFFIRNYQEALHPGGIYTGHFWSLAIEEHFYLIWPGLLAFLGRIRAFYAALIGAALCAVWRSYCVTVNANSTISPYFIVIRTDCRLDGLLIGCALAILLCNDSVRQWIYRNFPKETPLLCGFPMILLLSHSLGLPSLWLYLLIAVSLTSTLVVQEGLAHKWLNFPPLVWLGRISYGLYVYQEVFLMHPRGADRVPLWQLFPLNIVAALFIATVSFYFIERPLMRMVHRPRRHDLSVLTAVPSASFDEASPTGLA